MSSDLRPRDLQVGGLPGCGLRKVAGVARPLVGEHYEAMTTATWITMIVILGFVWGGFAVVLTRAVRKEGAKRRGDGGPEAG